MTSLTAGRVLPWRNEAGCLLPHKTHFSSKVLPRPVLQRTGGLAGHASCAARQGELFIMQLTRCAAMRVGSTLNIHQQPYLRGYAIAMFAPAGGCPCEPLSINLLTLTYSPLPAQITG